MTTFAISSSSKSDSLNVKLKELFGEENFYQVDDVLRIIISEKDVTAGDVFKKITEGKEINDEYGRYVIFSVTSYFGYHDVNLWNWMKAKGV
ncbi:hypothetical protein [Rahnella aceris]|uniref:hypothetical protein n=1 Tax=Rahnella sp. (strain Y9602) TaxID=2703885 RepID=UPI00366272B8